MTIMWKIGTFMFWNIYSLDHQEAHKECKESMFLLYMRYWTTLKREDKLRSKPPEFV